MKKELVIILSIILIVSIAMSINFKNPLITYSFEDRDNAEEILIGTVSNLETIDSGQCYKNKTFSFKISNIVSTTDNLKVGDTIKVNYLERTEETECNINYREFVSIYNKDYLKLYLFKQGENYILTNGEDSKECLGCLTNILSCPGIGTRFNYQETLEIYKIPSNSKELTATLLEHQGSYCSDENNMKYFSLNKEECEKNYECYSNNCENNICSKEQELELPPMPELPEPEVVVKEKEENQSETNLTTLQSKSFWQTLIDWIWPF